MHLKLLKELLNLDEDVVRRQSSNKTLSLSSDKTLKQKPKSEKTKLKSEKTKLKSEKTKLKRQEVQSDDYISSNLMRTIVDAHEPIDVDLKSISDYDFSDNSSYDSSYDSFYDLD
jgi:hypothetical protein